MVCRVDYKVKSMEVDGDQIKLQVQDTASLGLTKNDLQDSQKVS